VDDKKTILLVEDEKNISDIVKSYLESDGFEILTAFNGLSGLKLYQSNNIDLIILDLMLPDIDGFKVCKLIRNIGETPIIILTSKIKDIDIISCLNIGADDYVTKPFSPGQLLARVKAILRRVSPENKEIKRIMEFPNINLSIDLEYRELFINGNKIILTPAEFSIISYFAKYPNKIFTREDLINGIFGDDYFGYDRTIDAHIKNLRKKIEEDTRNPSIVVTIHGIGYKFCGSLKK